MFEMDSYVGVDVLGLTFMKGDKVCARACICLLACALYLVNLMCILLGEQAVT